MAQEIEIRENGSKRVSLKCEGPSKTRKSQQKETEINRIIQKYDKTGTLHHVARTIPRFDDVSGGLDYKSALDTVNEAQQKFSELPSVVRSEFDNDPGKLIEFLNDPQNLDRASELGLVDKRDINMDGTVDAAEKAKSEQPAPVDTPASS